MNWISNIESIRPSAFRLEINVIIQILCPELFSCSEIRVESCFQSESPPMENWVFDPCIKSHVSLYLFRISVSLSIHESLSMERERKQNNVHFLLRENTLATPF